MGYESLLSSSSDNCGGPCLVGILSLTPTHPGLSTDNGSSQQRASRLPVSLPMSVRPSSFKYDSRSLPSSAALLIFRSSNYWLPFMSALRCRAPQRASLCNLGSHCFDLLRMRTHSVPDLPNDRSCGQLHRDGTGDQSYSCEPQVVSILELGIFQI